MSRPSLYFRHTHDISDNDIIRFTRLSLSKSSKPWISDVLVVVAVVVMVALVFVIVVVPYAP